MPSELIQLKTRFFRYECAVLAMILFALPAHAVTKKKFLVVIDPGHGGVDTGAVFQEKGKTYTEKEMTLQIARDLARELIIKGHNVILTRNEDRSVLLSDRTALANRLKADVFLSIHLNSSGEKIRHGGVETFILNRATDESSKRLADLENAVLKESSAKQESGDVSLIMKDMILDANLEPSRKLACAVQGKMKAAMLDRGIKQALFYVLLGTDMPSILIEAGFVNNSADRERVLTTKSRIRMAVQIATAVDDYRMKKTPTHCKIENENEFKRTGEMKRKQI